MIEWWYPCRNQRDCVVDLLVGCVQHGRHAASSIACALQVGHGVKAKLAATGGLVDIITIQRDVQQQLEAGMPPEQAAAAMQSKAGVFIDSLFKIKCVWLDSWMDGWMITMYA